MRVYRTSADVFAFEVALNDYRNDPVISQIEANHRIRAVEEYTIANCDGLRLASFYS